MVLNSKRFKASALIGSLLLSAGLLNAGAAFAQTKPAAPKPSAGAPAAPAAADPAANDNKVVLQAAQADWTKVCGKDEAAGKEVCYTTRDFGQAADQPPVLAMAVYDVKGDEKRMLRLLMPVALMLKPGFRYAIDAAAPREGAFAICFPNGCFAESEMGADVVKALKAGQKLSVTVRNQVGNEVVFTLPLEGFGKAFDGAAIDPKVLQQQQEQLQKNLEEAAKKKREELEKGGATAPAPGAPAPAAPAPAK